MSYSGAAASPPYQFKFGLNVGLSCNAMSNSEAPTTLEHQWTSSPPLFDTAASDAQSPRSSSPELEEMQLCGNREEGIQEPDASRPTTTKKIRMPQRKGGMQLWQFMYALLQDSQAYSDLIEWTENRSELEFRLLEPEAVAAWWGNIRHKPTMNYEKLSRSLRYYYDKGILKKMGGERYLYRFCVDPEEMYRHIGNSDSRPGLKPMPLTARQCMSKYMAMTRSQNASFFSFSAPDPLQLSAPPAFRPLQQCMMPAPPPPPPYPFDIPPALDHAPWDYPEDSSEGQFQSRRRFNSWEDCSETASLPQTLPPHVMLSGVGHLQERSFSTSDLPHAQPVGPLDPGYPPHPNYSTPSYLAPTTCSSSSPSFSTESDHSCDADLAEILSITAAMDDNAPMSLPSNSYTTGDDIFFSATFTNDCPTTSMTNSFMNSAPYSSVPYGNMC